MLGIHHQDFRFEIHHILRRTKSTNRLSSHGGKACPRYARNGEIVKEEKIQFSQGRVWISLGFEVFRQKAPPCTQQPTQ